MNIGKSKAQYSRTATNRCSHVDMILVDTHVDTPIIKIMIIIIIKIITILIIIFIKITNYNFHLDVYKAEEPFNRYTYRSNRCIYCQTKKDILHSLNNYSIDDNFADLKVSNE